ncbi:glycosyltransferase family 2 protein [Sphaerospermopsis torques-reginae]|uniref:Glycosyltransferase family 2 protein n=1 Tax=Sphaerospermopsis torques-reginae ITEP-024 TaxID=984208 RepID=A0ABX8WUQ3_9CYAN|nr:glycosyltransferase family A protein [Sphaerospermopsis torques-reginae]QYX30152.1 glycosyltransferase family 2 protein [Sphaerospermopsis torques-reginae ITEP-024]
MESDVLSKNYNNLIKEREELTKKYEYLLQEIALLNQSNNSLKAELLEIKNSRTWRVITQLKQNLFVNKLGKILLNLMQFIKLLFKDRNLLLSNLTRRNQMIRVDTVDNGENYVSSYQFQQTLVLHKYQPGSPISIVIICYNKSKELPYVISAIAKNTLRPDLVVLCDDGSTDDSVQRFIDACESQFLTYKIIQEEPKPNAFRLNTLRNQGVAVCPDGLVIILDADHVPSSTHIQAHVNLHLSNPQPVLSTGPRLEYANPDCSGAVNFLWGHEPISMMQHSSDQPIASWTGVLVSNMGMCKQAILELGGFDPIYDGNYGYDDIDFTYRAWLAGYFFASCFETYIIHIPHPPSLGVRDNSINQRKFEAKYKFHPKYPQSVERLTREAWHNYLRCYL